MQFPRSPLAITEFSVEVAEDLRPSIDEFEAVKVSTSDQTFKGTRRKMK